MTIESLETTLDYSFHKKSLLHKSLTHSSYINEHPDTFAESNERLEFLGDAILGHVVALELFLQYPSWSEGKLTHGRSALVNGDALAKLSRQLGLGELLYMGIGEEKSGGRLRPNNLAAALESVIGAAFLDGGYAVARDIIVGLISDDIRTLGDHPIREDPKSSFQEVVKAMGLPTPIYQIVKEDGADHSRTFTAEVIVGGRTIATGIGSRKNLAEREAAKVALVVIKDF